MKDRMGSELTPSLLKKLLDQRWTYRQIGDHFGKSVPAVKSMATREGLQKPRRQLLPIEVRPEHKNDPETGSSPYPYRMLRVREAMLAGEEVSQAQRDRYEGWLDMLYERHAVVFYKPTGSQAGWHYVDGDPGASDWPIHELCLADGREAA